jgi:hypothetical protein
VRKTLAEREKALFDRFARVAQGVPTEAVAGAAANVVINALMQLHASPDEAKKAFAKIELMMLQRYDVRGRSGILAVAKDVLRV